ncbi:MAG: hypothetical protein AAGI44_18275 [Pseudomonadota bacterium]
MKDSIYANIDHALQRAFGQPRPEYGKMMVDVGVMQVSNGLSSEELIAQDGMVRYLLENELDTGQRMMLYLVYDTCDDLHHFQTALEMYTEIFTGKNERFKPFVRESVLRWSGRDRQRAWTTMKEWSRDLNTPRSTLAYRRHAISDSLERIHMNALGAAHQSLHSRDLIP